MGVLSLCIGYQEAEDNTVYRGRKWRAGTGRMFMTESRGETRLRTQREKQSRRLAIGVGGGPAVSGRVLKEERQEGLKHTSRSFYNKCEISGQAQQIITLYFHKPQTATIYQ